MNTQSNATATHEDKFIDRKDCPVCLADIVIRRTTVSYAAVDVLRIAINEDGIYSTKVLRDFPIFDDGYEIEDISCENGHSSHQMARHTRLP